MKKLLVFIVMAAVSVLSASAFIDSYTISRDKLPEAAQEMLKEHFPKGKVSMIKIDRHLLKKTDYDVRLVNGTTIEFSNAGKWKSVDCKSRAVPEALVPKAVRRHVDKNHAGLKIVKIEKKASGYHIGLSDGKLLKYNHLGHFTGFVNAAEAESEGAEAES